MKIFAIRDLQADIYGSTFTSVNEATATRDVKVFLKQKNQFSDFPQDYDLYCLGNFEESTGNIYPKLTKVCSLSILKEENNNA